VRLLRDGPNGDVHDVPVVRLLVGRVFVMAARWFVAVCEPRDELSCIAAMKFVGIEAFSPHERFARKDQWKRWQLVAKPKAPGYVFCLLDADTLPLALGLRHVWHVLPGRGRHPLPVARSEERRVEALRDAEAADMLIGLEERLPKRERPRRASPALWEQYVVASARERGSLLGEKLHEAVLGLLEPGTMQEAA
jgi:hypothetical protein